MMKPVPDDEQLAAWLQEQVDENDKKLLEVLMDLEETRIKRREEGPAEVFAYGKLLNFLRSEEFTEPDLIRLCAAALWELSHNAT